MILTIFNLCVLALAIIIGIVFTYFAVKEGDDPFGSIMFTFFVSMSFITIINWSDVKDVNIGYVNKSQCTIVLDNAGYLIRCNGKTIIEGDDVKTFNLIKEGEFKIEQRLSYNILNNPDDYYLNCKLK